MACVRVRQTLTPTLARALALTPILPLTQTLEEIRQKRAAIEVELDATFEERVEEQAHE